MQVMRNPTEENSERQDGKLYGHILANQVCLSSKKL